MILSLAVTKREKGTDAEHLRAVGSIPAVFYGPKEAPQPIAIDAKAFAKVFTEAGETTLVQLTGVGDTKETLIKDVQLDPMTGKPLHADFYVLEKGKKVTLNIPLEFVGNAPAEKAGHILVKALYEIEIEVAPHEIPHELNVDVSALANVGDHILVKDIKLPASAELITDGEEIIASVTEFVEEKVEEVAPAATEGAAPAEGAAAPAEEKKEE